MNTMLKTLAVFVFVAGAVTWLATAANAELLCNFENGSADYNSTASGKFRDAGNGTYINLSANGAANDCLIMGRYGSGSAFTSTMYDLTPNNTSSYNMFKTPVGYTTIITADVAFDVQSYISVGAVFIFDPTATGTSTKKGIGFEYRDSSSGVDDNAFIRYVKTESSNDSDTYAIMQITSIGRQLDAPIVRLTLSFTNNGANATITGRMDRIAALEGNVTETTALWNSGPLTLLNYGTASGQLNMDPANRGFEIGLCRNISGGADANVYFDRLTVVTVPEPSTLALLAAGLVGLLAYAWRKRK